MKREREGLRKPAVILTMARDYAQKNGFKRVRSGFGVKTRWNWTKTSIMMDRETADRLFITTDNTTENIENHATLPDIHIWR